jgi:hypothetical protein
VGCQSTRAVRADDRNLIVTVGILQLDAGVIAEHGTTEKILRRPANPGTEAFLISPKLKINDRSNFWGVLSEPELNGTDFAVLCVVLLTPLNCRILGLHNCDTERREASLIPQMETGTCRVAHFPLPHTPEFRLGAVGSAVAS